MSLLTKREKQVLELRRKLTQVEVAKQLKLSQACISVFERKGKKKILDAKKTLLFANKYKIVVEDEE